MVLPIGGADMPVVISLLNSFTGTAVAMAGFVLGNPVLIIAGALVGASGAILTKLMADAMNRSVLNIMVGGFGGGEGTVGAGGRRAAASGALGMDDAAIQLAYASNVIIVPGYGLAVAQAQHAVRELAELLEDRGVDVSYAIHPVAGRMPGHMNVLLAEANVPYPQLQGDGGHQPRVLAGGRGARRRRQRRHQPGRAARRAPVIGDADPRRRPREDDHRDQALDGSRLRRHRQRAVREPQDRDAVRRREARVPPGALPAPFDACRSLPRPARAGRRASFVSGPDRWDHCVPHGDATADTCRPGRSVGRTDAESRSMAATGAPPSAHDVRRHLRSDGGHDVPRRRTHPGRAGR